MKDIRVVEVKLVHGAKKLDFGYKGQIEAIEPYRYKLILPLGDITEVEIRPVTVGAVLAIHKRISGKHATGSSSYRKAFTEESLKERVTPQIEKRQLREMAGVDYDNIERVINYGIGTDGQKAFQLKAGAETTKTALVRLHNMVDRDAAESAAGAAKEENPILHQIHLAHICTYIGEPKDASWDYEARGEVESFLSLSWDDFTPLSEALFDEDYTPLTELLDGPVKGAAGTVPFQGVSETDSDEAEKGSGRGKAKSN